MSKSQIPERLINFNVYANGSNKLAGVADATLPNLEPMSDTVSGAGIAGEYESPVLGHFGSLTLGINFRTLTDEALNLSAPVSHTLDLRGSIQVLNSGTGVYETRQVRVMARGTNKSADLGSLAAASAMDSALEFEITYLKLYIGGVEKVEIDKLNFKHVVNGVDYLESVRKDI